MWRIVPGVVYHWNAISLLERDHSLILLQVLCVPVSKNAIRSSVLCLFRRMLFALVEKVAIYGHDPDPNPQMMTNGWLHVEPVMPIWIPHLLQENRLERLQIKHSSLAQGLDYRSSWKISCQQKDLVPVDSVRSSNRAGTHWSIQRISLPDGQRTDIFFSRLAKIEFCSHFT